MYILKITFGSRSFVHAVNSQNGAHFISAARRILASAGPCSKAEVRESWNPDSEALLTIEVPPANQHASEHKLLIIGGTVLKDQDSGRDCLPLHEIDSSTHALLGYPEPDANLVSALTNELKQVLEGDDVWVFSLARMGPRPRTCVTIGRTNVLDARDEGRGVWIGMDDVTIEQRSLTAPARIARVSGLGGWIIDSPQMADTANAALGPQQSPYKVNDFLPHHLRAVDDGGEYRHDAVAEALDIGLESAAQLLATIEAEFVEDRMGESTPILYARPISFADIEDLLCEPVQPAEKTRGLQHKAMLLFLGDSADMDGRHLDYLFGELERDGFWLQERPMGPVLLHTQMPEPDPDTGDLDEDWLMARFHEVLNREMIQNHG